jgi:hypothetical protein
VESLGHAWHTEGCREHSLDIRVGARPVKQPLRRFDEEKRRAIGEEIHKLMLQGSSKRYSIPNG